MKLITAALVAVFSADAANPTTTTPPAPAAPTPAAPTLPAQLARVDELYRRRDERVPWTEMQQLVVSTLARAPNDYGVLWRAARLYYWLSDDPAVTNEQRSKWGEQGWALAERAIGA